MMDSVNRELTGDVFKLRFVKRTIWKRCLNSGQIDIIGMEFFHSTITDVSLGQLRGKHEVVVFAAKLKWTIHCNAKLNDVLN